MASDGQTIKRLAREVANELENRGYLVTPQEAAAAMEASRPDPGARCVGCGARVSPGQKKCDRCGSTQAIDSATPLECGNCGAPIGDAEWPTCTSCGSTKARIASARVTPQDPKAPFECIRCGFPVYDLNVPECPGGCGETRAVKRNHGHPSRTVVS